MMFQHFDQSEYAAALKNAYRQFPAKDSTLDIDFVNNRQRVAGIYGAALDGVTFTRSTTGTYVNAAGVLQTAAINEPRFEYDPVSLSPMGFLIEGSRTNSIRNNTMVGAVNGTPGTLPTNWTTYTTLTGLTRTVVGSGTIDGISYVDIQLSGTPSGSGDYGIYFDTTNAISATNGQTWTQSVFLAIVGGSTANVGINLRVDENTAAGAFVSNKTGPSLTVTSTLSRAESGALTLNGGATVGAILPWLRLTLTAGSAVNITLRIGLPQLELGAFATSVIPTSGTATTRGADVATMTGANFSNWYNQSQGTFLAIFRERVGINTISVTYRHVFLASGTEDATSRISILVNNADMISSEIYTGGAAQAIFTGQTNTGQTKACIVYDTNDTAFTDNSAPPSFDNSVTTPTLTQIQFGKYFDSNVNGYLFGHLQRIIYDPKRLSNNLLQYLTRLTA